MKRYRLLFIVFAILSTDSLKAQVINGPSSATINDIKTYTINTGTAYNTYTWWFGNSAGAQIQSQSVSGTTYTLNVKWTMGGSNSVNFSPRGSTIATRSVTIACTTFPAVPTNGVGGLACGSGQGTISATPGSGGTSIRWYNVSSGGSIIGSGSSYTGNAGNYYASTFNSTLGCESTTRLTVTISSGTAPSPPTNGSSTRVCGSGSATLSATADSQGMVVWFDNNTTGTRSSGALGTGTPFTSPPISSTTTFYMGTYNPANGCDTSPNARVAVTATVVAPPSVPPAPSFTTNQCGPKTLSYNAASVPSATTWYWQTSVNGRSSVSSAQSYPVTSSGSYYLAAKYDVCWSNTSLPATVTVNLLPDAPPTVSPVSRCGPGTVTLNATPHGGDISRWYSASTGGSVLATTNSYQPTVSTSTTYYASSYNSTTGCESANPRTAVPVTVNTVPTFTNLPASPSICSATNASITPAVSPSGTYSWTMVPSGSLTGYGATSGTTAISTTPTNNASTNGTLTYTITPTLGGCSGTAKNYTVTVKPKPTVASAPSSQTICSSQATSLTISNPNAVSGTTFSWTAAPQSGVTGTSSGTGSSIAQTLSNSNTAAATATYTITATANSCASTPLNVVVTVNRALGAGTVGTAQTICYNTTPVQLTQTGGAVGGNASYTYQWQSSLNGTTWAAASGTNNGTTYNPPALTANTYYRRQVTSCTNITAQSNTITISVDPLSVGGTVSSYQAFGSASGNVNLSGATGSVAFWEEKVEGGSFVPNTNTTTSQAYNTTQTKYFHASVKSGVCPAVFSSTGSVTIFSVPQLSATPASVAPGGSTSISTSSGLYSYQWYKDNAIISGQSANVLPVTRPGAYKLVAKAGATSPSYETPELIIDPFDQDPVEDNNYIQTTIYNVAGVTSATDVYGLTRDKYAISTSYADGLGRSLQTVALGGSGNGNDIIQPVVYDEFGRESTKYLPYAASSRDGRYRPTAVTDQSSFYTNADKVAHDPYPYSVTRFETSAMNRVIEQGSPGASWQPDATDSYTSADHTIKKNYGTNNTNEVLLWTYTLPTSAYPFGRVNTGTGSTPAYYPVNTLSKSSTKDEDFNEVIVYTDKHGNVILKKVQAGVSQYASTYYIYDNLDQLVAVIPPEATRRLPTEYYQAGATDGSKETFLRRWAFRYTYDYRSRVKLRQVPGADSVRIVYDKRDRVVLTQDGNQRPANKWTCTKYDNLNRPVMTGIYTHTAGVTQAQMSALITTTFAESYNGTGTTGYTNTVWPTTNLEVLTVTYYDNYNFKSLIGSSSYDYNPADRTGQEPTAFDRVIGQVTGTKTNILGSTNYLWSVRYYDPRYRLIQTQSQNHMSGIDRETFIYDFSGKQVNYKRTYVNSGVTRTVRGIYSHDEQGRPTTVTHMVDGSPNLYLLSNAYNALGQLIDKKLYSTDGTNYAQSIDYRYNIRGWLLSMNNSQLTNNGTNNDDSNDLFGMELGYDNSLNTGNSGLYNGNISGMKWSKDLALGTVKDIAYNYSYDTMNRISDASFRVNGAGGWTTPGSFSETGYAYDLNGNITALTRKDKAGSSIDILSYDYANTGNQLKNVTDTGDKTKGFIEPASTTGSDYSYDANGNMTVDQNKGITAITYNTLNLPVQVNKGPSDYIVYTYDATGRKLRQQVFGSEAKTTDYDGELVFENNVPLIFNHPEGRVVNLTTTPEYQYHLKDHLGNVRMTFTTATPTETYSAGFETSNQATEAAKFDNYPSGGYINTVAVNAHSGTNSNYLNGGYNGQVGVAKSFSVMPGDTLSIQAYAKYNTPTPTTSNLTGFATALLAAFSLPAPAAGEVGTPSAALQYWGGLEAAGNGDGGDDPLKVFVNILIFDRDFVFKDVAYAPLITSGALMTKTYTVQEPGYAFLYISNEHPYLVDVYFDDVTISLTPGKVVQEDDYYPFGLSFNSYSRENSLPNPYQFNGKEKQDELSLGLYDYIARQYDPILGRFTSIDPAADLMRRISPYAYSFNNPIRFTDPDGMVPGDFYNENGLYLGSDGKDDNKVYQTTETAYENHVDGEAAMKSGEEDFDRLKSNSDTHYLGTKNEFGLIRLTGMGNEHIENYGNEDSYSYTNSEGNTVEAGQHGDDWVIPEVGAAFNAKVNDLVSEPGNENLVVDVNDASAYNPEVNLGHVTHFQGKSIDMPFLKTDGTHSNNINNLSAGDISLNGNFVGKLQGAGFTRNYSDNATIPGTSHAAGHKDHLHVGKP